MFAEGRRASGFPCPICSHHEAVVVHFESSTIVWLRCMSCEEIWRQDVLEAR